MTRTAQNFPTVLVVLGATGDLAQKKIFPSLFHLYEKDKLPKLLRIVGFSRREWGDDNFRQFVKDVLAEHEDIDAQSEKFNNFLNSLSYTKGLFEELDDYKNLATLLGNVDGKWEVCANKLFYLAVPPKFYEDILNNLDGSKLTEPCGPEEGWTRVIIEKPFGKDLITAENLDNLLGGLFKEEQIFRIDHYLGKDMLQNILSFRFSNNIFEQSWSNKYIDNIEIKILEKEGIKERGEFYDGVGALRDVGQNHLLQMLALVTMGNPGALDADKVRNERENILRTLNVLDEDEIHKNTIRAQYKGYKEVGGVGSDSTTETYFKLRGSLGHSKWKGVPFTLEAGKAMGESKKEIVVRFRHPHPCLCPPGAPHEYHNKVIFALEPEEEITFRLWSKRPGYKLEVEKRSFDLPYRRKRESDGTEEYEKLLLDCFLGDQTSFVSTKEIEEMWKYIDPVLEGWRNGAVQLKTYEKGTNDIRNIAKEKINSNLKSDIKKEIAIVGLGKMGANIARNLIGNGWEVLGYNRTKDVTKKLEKDGINGIYTYEEITQKMTSPRAVWVMVPAGEPTTNVIKNLSNILEKGDIVIDGGNSFYEESKKHFQILKEKGIDFVDVGVSGGPEGAKEGACLMIGGNKKLYEHLLPLYVDLAIAEGQQHFDGVGAGHFVKMVHNGIEYGMMQAIAEGFDVMRSSEYKLHLGEIARVYNNGSVVESRLIEWMQEAYEVFGEDLEKVSGSAGSGGAAGMEKSEAKWTIKVAETLNIPAKVINEAINARLESQEKPNFQGKVINALRNRFGGHKVNK